MKISIVIPAYNAEQFLERTVDSVLAQTRTDWELVILDDGSVDGTFTVAQRFAEGDSRIRVVKTGNGGVANARNAGYRETNSDSEYVIFLDHDDTWQPHALARLMVALEESPQSIAAHALARTTDLEGTPNGQIHSWERRKVAGNQIKTCDRVEPTTFAVLICDCAISTPGVGLIRRAAFDKIKQPHPDPLLGKEREKDIYFDQAVATGDDWDMWLRLSLHGEIAFVDEVLLDWRQHGDNGSQNETATFASELRVRHKMSTWPELDAEQRRMADWRYQRVYASIERRNAKTCGRWFVQSLRRGRLGEAARFASTWLRTYAHYVGLRMFWESGRQTRPIPARLVETAQVLKS